MNNEIEVRLEPVQTEAEELLFYTDKLLDEKDGCIGHLRIDFGKSGDQFFSTWSDHSNKDGNDSIFKKEFDAFINDLRQNVLKSRRDMRDYCRGKDDCRNTHSYYDDCWGFRCLTNKYAYYVRCTPVEGDYECYVYAYDKSILMRFLAEKAGLAEFCYTHHPVTNEPVIIRYAERGYYPDHCPDGSTVEELNKLYGVSHVKQIAMEVGSIFGWKVPGADPKNYVVKEKEKMKIAIYQINLEKDDNYVAFEGLDEIEKLTASREVDSSLYDKVYEYEMEGKSLEDVYRKFNLEQPEGFHARSLSVSDVVEVIESDTVKPGFYFCDTVGFEKVEFEPSLSRETKQDKIKVLIVEPEKEPYVKEIDSGLESLQHEVDGDIEAFYPTADEVAFICNEEGKIIGLPLNRAVRGDDGEMIDIIAGTFMIVGLGEGNFSSLDEKMIEKYSDKFKSPELFARVNGKIHVIPMNNAPEKDTPEKRDVKPHSREER